MPIGKARILTDLPPCSASRERLKPTKYHIIVLLVLELLHFGNKLRMIPYLSTRDPRPR